MVHKGSTFRTSGCACVRNDRENETLGADPRLFHGDKYIAAIALDREGEGAASAVNCVFEIF